jgi:hypothetical protein
MTPEECLNSAMVALDFAPLRDLVLDAFVSDHSNDCLLRGRILSQESHLLAWQPSDTPALLPRRFVHHHQPQQQPQQGVGQMLPLATPIGQPDWLTRRTDTGALAEFFIFNYINEAYGNKFPLSSWVSSAKRRFFPDDHSRVNDALGADFEFQDTLGIFAKTKGALLRLEVKGTVRSTVTQFEISRNELKGLVSCEAGSEYVIVLVANVASDFRPPNIYAVIRDVNSLLDLQPIQFVALFDLHAPKKRGLVTGDWSLGSLFSTQQQQSPPPPPPVPAEVPIDPDSVEADFFEDMQGESIGKLGGRKDAMNPKLTVFESSDDEASQKKKQKRTEPALTKSSWYV